MDFIQIILTELQQNIYVILLMLIVSSEAIIHCPHIKKIGRLINLLIIGCPPLKLICLPFALHYSFLDAFFQILTSKIYDVRQ
ncbi:hypothetical protein FGO68_gene11946 [Halteria grandinella]|uniref:Uncharacterized protein n=1 Tax=Halteria grandinella TaxID=5974 RepID=A0A8J8NTZ2_HALGN|nr:hypothetical protein FGO68_gene11946 [Halteria grandinella]